MAETMQEEGLILDWLSFTFKYDGGLDSVKFLLGDWQELDRGIRGYSNAGKLACQGVVGWHPTRPKQGVHVELSGSQLGRQVELNPAYSDPRGFLLALVNMDASITRADFALDDRSGQLSMGTIGSAIREESLVTRFRGGRHVEGILGGLGDTYELGNRKSNSFIRIYDKQAQQLGRKSCTEDPGHWIRVELELKHEKAHAAALGFLDMGAPFIIGLIRGLIEFKERSVDQNKSKWPVSPWWDTFLRGAEKQKLSPPKARPSLERTMAWLENQVAPSLAFVTEASGGEVDWLYRLISAGGHRLSQAQRQLISIILRESEEQDE